MYFPDGPFRYLHISPELVCEFFAIFSKMEYAPKSAGFVNSNDASANWDTFANAINSNYQEEKLKEKQLRDAADYLLKIHRENRFMNVVNSYSKNVLLTQVKKKRSRYY